MTHPYTPPKRLLCLTLGSLLMSCGWAETGNVAAPTSVVALQDFSGSQKVAWKNQLADFLRGKRDKLRIIQLGDSHTAGDFFSQEVRQRLQAQYGNGGIGWVYPGQVAGQRMAQVTYQMGAWQTITSRRNTDDFPAGGIIAQSLGRGGDVTIRSRMPIEGLQSITVWLKPQQAQEPLFWQDGSGNRYVLNADVHKADWQRVTIPATLPFTYGANNGDGWQVGGVNIENTQRGVVYSAMGINGAQLSQTSRWRASWLADLVSLRPDVVVVSFGTNEAFNGQLDINAMKSEWLRLIGAMQKQLPQSAIVIVGAPESLTSLNGECGVRPANLTAVQQAQRAIAEQVHVLYWDWQAAMGGSCTMKTWVAQKWGRADGVHFSAIGYEKAAGILAQSLIQYLNMQK
ncbi:GDSL-type esterase/lipase family protein [Snodgrassella sp. CFCC 13594]|uniref:GDSL-type esterase/lipase family protein n=1 Tax=Snodgrassella sp. CFCC 13594 TaxID=1775559 RepID=UPI00082BD854|nr:GDSL-type esterase/lipase family protein [Snodgrassella sp. CFCC 13594]